MLELATHPLDLAAKPVEWVVKPALRLVKGSKKRIEEALPFTFEPKVSKVQDFVPIEFVGKDIIKLTDGTCLAILRINPQNVFLKTDSEIKFLTDQYEEHVRSVNYPFQIIVSAQPQNIDQMITRLDESQQKARAGKPFEAQMAVLGKEELQAVRDTHEENPMMKYDYYVVIPADPPKTEDMDEDEKKEQELESNISHLPYRKRAAAIPDGVAENLDVKVGDWRTKLDNLGLVVERVTTGEILDILHEQLNPDLSKQQSIKSSTHEQLAGLTAPILTDTKKLIKLVTRDGKNGKAKQQDAEKTIKLDKKQKVTVHNLLFGPGSRDLVDITAPARLNVAENALELDNSDVRVLKVTDIRQRLEDAELRHIFGKKVPFVFSFHFDTYPKADAEAMLDDQLLDFHAQQQRDAAKGNDPDDELEQTISHHEALKDGLVNDTKTVLSMRWYVGLRAPRTERKRALRTNQARLEGVMGGRKIFTRELTDRQHMGYLATLPLLTDPMKDEMFAPKRDIDSGAVAALMPFIGNNIFDENGVPFGINTDLNSTILFDLHSPRFTQKIMMIFGAPGRGKSYAAKSLAYRDYLFNGRPFTAIDQGNTDEWFKLMRFLHEPYIYLGPNSSARINPCDLLPPKTHGDLDRDPLGRKMAELRQFVSLLLRTIDWVPQPGDHTILSTSIEKMYENAQITRDRRTHFRRPPLLRDLQTALETYSGGTSEDKARARTLAGYLDIYTKNDFGAMFFDQTNISMHGSAAFNLAGLEGKHWTWGMRMVNGFTWDQAQLDFVQRSLYIDEGWKALEDVDGMSMIDTSTRESRRNRIAVVLMTHLPKDGVQQLRARQAEAEKAPQSQSSIAIDAASNILLLGQEDAALDDIQAIFKLSNPEREAIHTQVEGKGIFISGGMRNSIQTIKSSTIHRILTTKGEEVERIIEEEREALINGDYREYQRPRFALGQGTRLFRN